MEPPHLITSASSKKPKLLDQVRAAIRTQHYSAKTEKAYVQWIKRFILHHNQRHPAETGYGIPTIQELLGHKNLNTTMIYTHVLNRGGRGIRSPADNL